MRDYFNSRPLYRGRRLTSLPVVETKIFQLTPPIQRATVKEVSGTPAWYSISTHAPYTEGDSREVESCNILEVISTHAPYTEGDRLQSLNG